MDAFLYNLERVRQAASAGYYAPRHPLPPLGLERRVPFGLAPADLLSPYARLPIDRQAGYAVPSRNYETDLIAPHSRTGVDTVTNKRMADNQIERSMPTKKRGKKQRGEKKKPAQRRRRAKWSLPTEEQILAAESSLVMQRQVRKSVLESLGLRKVAEAGATQGLEGEEEEPDESELPDTQGLEGEEQEPDESEQPDSGAEEAINDSEETDKKPVEKPVEPQRTPEEEKNAEAKSFKFFAELFAANAELRNLYIDNCKFGCFNCLLCDSVHGKTSKRFWNVNSVVIHTKMVLHRRPEHTGYGRAVSAILGWDHAKTPRAPLIVRPKGLSGKSLGEARPKQERVEAAGERPAVMEIKDETVTAVEGK